MTPNPPSPVLRRLYCTIASSQVIGVAVREAAPCRLKWRGGDRLDSCPRNPGVVEETSSVLRDREIKPCWCYQGRLHGIGVEDNSPAKSRTLGQALAGSSLPGGDPGSEFGDQLQLC